MSVVYDGIHSITFIREDDSIVRNTWGDFHLVPAVRPHIEPPPAQVKMLSLPRSNKILDLTNALTRDVIYDAREGDWEFYIDHDKWEDWTKSFDAYADYFDGSVFYLFLDDEPNYIYHGRVYVADYKPDASYSKIRIHYNLDPLVKEYEWSADFSYGPYRFSPGIQQYNQDDEYVYIEHDPYGSNEVMSRAIGIAYEPIIKVQLYGIYKDIDYKLCVHIPNRKYTYSLNIPEGSFIEKEKSTFPMPVDGVGPYNAETYFVFTDKKLMELDKVEDYNANEMLINFGVINIYDDHEGEPYGEHFTDLLISARREGIVI